jgi:hypothetical protein
MAGRWSRKSEGAALWQLFADQLVEPHLSGADYIESVHTDYFQTTSLTFHVITFNTTTAATRHFT